MSLKIPNFLISYPIVLKLFLIGLSDFSATIESKLFLVRKKRCGVDQKRLII